MLESHCRYVDAGALRRPALHVHTRCVDVRGARFRYEYAIVRDDGALMADGYTSHACVDVGDASRRRACRSGSSAAIASVESGV